MFWLSSLPQWRRFRDVSVSTEFNMGGDALTLYENEDEHLQPRGQQSVRYLPAYATSYGMWYKGRYVTVSRAREESRWDDERSTLTITSVYAAYIQQPLL